jgi:hypothetical protein
MPNRRNIVVLHLLPIFPSLTFPNGAKLVDLTVVIHSMISNADHDFMERYGITAMPRPEFIELPFTVR